MSLSWRVATIEDLGDVISLLRDDDLGQGRETADLEVYRQAFSQLCAQDGNMIVVGVSDGEVIATYQLTIIPGLSLNGSIRVQLEGVRVRSDHRGRGLGSALIHDVEERARAHRAELLQLTMKRSRDAAHQFYEARGFVPSHVGFKLWLKKR